jgi:threonine dehydratase
VVWCVSCVQDRAIREGLTFVAPYDDPHTIAGQGTIGDEILRQVMTALGVLTEASVGPCLLSWQ